MAHNTVTVNRRDQFRSTNQDRGNRGHLFTAGDLQLYEPNLAGISVVEVDGARAYQGVASRYQRMLVLNASDPVRPLSGRLVRWADKAPLATTATAAACCISARGRTCLRRTLVLVETSR
jgi:hypothetical protein